MIILIKFVKNTYNIKIYIFKYNLFYLYENTNLYFNYNT